MAHKTYAESSRMGWGRPDGQSLTLEQINTGCLQRIADATELMAKRHEQLIADRESAIRSRDYWRNEYDRLLRRFRSQKGVITKLKRSKP